MTSLVDWDVAAATAGRLVPPGPRVTPAEAAAVVAELRDAAVRAERHVRAFTGLAADQEPPPATVVDRPGWVRANVDGLRAVVAPLVDTLVERSGARRPPALVAGLAARVTGAEAGLLLSYLAARVLGQYEIFLPAGQGEGRLTLVAPNIVHAERALRLDPSDFRLWVCLHEVTHRTQFTAVPWLRDHVLAELTAYLDASDLDPAALAGRLRAALGAVVDSVRGRPGPSLVEAVQTPGQRAVLDRVTGLMSLVEGHAEYVMDGVGPQVVPSVAQIRHRFDTRRRQGGPVERVLRRLLGLELKMRQYAEGRRFVAAVVDQVGMAGFNRVWTSPATLPTRDEIADPAAWVTRVVGPPAVPA